MTYRTIRLEREYEEALAKLREQTSDADAYHRGLEWLLSRRAEWGYTVARTPNLRVWPFHIGERRYAVYYRFDENFVTLVRLFSVPADPDWYR